MAMAAATARMPTPSWTDRCVGAVLIITSSITPGGQLRKGLAGPLPYGHKVRNAHTNRRVSKRISGLDKFLSVASSYNYNWSKVNLQGQSGKGRVLALDLGKKRIGLALS